MAIDLNSFDLDDTATDDVRDRIIRPISAVAVLIADNFGTESPTVLQRDTLRRLLWARNQLWYCMGRQEESSLLETDCRSLFDVLTTIDSTTEASLSVTQAVSELVIKLDADLKERADKFFAYQYLAKARNLFLKSLDNAHA